MARRVLVSVTLLLVALVAATTAVDEVFEPYHVIGKTYCDNCGFGFETNITQYIPGATVELQCTGRSDSSAVVYKAQVKTDSSGSFEFIVSQDHGDQCCDVVLKDSPWPDCKSRDKGRDKSRVIVTDFNGIVSRYRHANNLGFVQSYVDPECAELKKIYFHSSDQ